MKPTRIGVTAAAGAYSVIIGAGTLASLPAELDAAGLGPRRIIVASKRVWTLHGQRFRRATTERLPVLVDDGERYKNLVTVGKVHDALVKANADRSTGSPATWPGLPPRPTCAAFASCKSRPPCSHRLIARLAARPA